MSLAETLRTSPWTQILVFSFSRFHYFVSIKLFSEDFPDCVGICTTVSYVSLKHIWMQV